VKVWARYAVPVMVLVDEDSDEIEKVVLVAGERDIDRARPSMNMLFYTEDLELISDSRQETAHALSVGDHCRWPDVSDWEIEQSWDGLRMLVDEPRHPSCPDCDGDGYTPADDPDAAPCPRCAGNGIIERDLGRHPDAEDRSEWRPEPAN
jgi:hypothetical protein